MVIRGLQAFAGLDGAQLGLPASQIADVAALVRIVVGLRGTVAMRSELRLRFD